MAMAFTFVDFNLLFVIDRLNFSLDNVLNKVMPPNLLLSWITHKVSEPLNVKLNG